MKIKTLFFTLLAVILTQNINAQVNSGFPSRADVEFMLDYIDKCKKDMDKLQEKIDGWAAIGTYPVQEYNDVRAELDEKQRCVDVCRKNLDTVRGKYPGWFGNGPSAYIDYSKGHSINGKGYEELVESLTEMMNRLAKAFKGLAKPK